MKVLVGSVLPNPFDKGPIDPKHVGDLRASLRATGGEYKLVARHKPEVPGFYEVDDGKHRLEAIKAESPKGWVDLEVQQLSDEMMFSRLILKNFVKRTVSDQELLAVVLEAEKFLAEHPAKCVRHKSKALSESDKLDSKIQTSKSKCPSQGCISQLLSIEGLSQPRISELLSRSRIKKDNREQHKELPEAIHAPIETIISPIPDFSPTDTGSMLDQGSKEPTLNIQESPTMLSPQAIEVRRAVEEDSALLAKMNTKVDEKKRIVSTGRPASVFATATDVLVVALKVSLKRTEGNLRGRGMSETVFIKTVESYLDEKRSGG